MQKKTISVSGFTKDQRAKDLERIKKKYKKKGYVFIEYIDDGITKSTAIFEVDEAILKKDKLTKIVAAVIIVVGLIYLSVSSSNSSSNIKADYTVKEAKLLSLNKIKVLSTNFVKTNNLNPEYNQKFYNCLGQMIWEKDDNLKTSKLLDWCYSDYLNTPNNSMNQYYNTAELLSGFSAWDGSYKTLVESVKSIMKDSTSFEHVKTTYRFVYYGTDRPHMVIIMQYRGANSFGAKVLGTVSAKVDAITKELYDIK